MSGQNDMGAPTTKSAVLSAVQNNSPISLQGVVLDIYTTLDHSEVNINQVSGFLKELCAEGKVAENAASPGQVITWSYSG